MKRLGFTGTRKGMTDWQVRRFREFLRFHRPAEFHHGDCMGADAQAHKLVRAMLPDCTIVIHPCDIVKMRANCKGDITLTPLPPLHRNHLIVDATDELQRSGTWATIRWAQRTGKRVEIIEPADPYAFLETHSQNTSKE
jgi:hypothetical protein